MKQLFSFYVDMFKSIFPNDSYISETLLERLKNEHDREEFDNAIEKLKSGEENSVDVTFANGETITFSS